MSLRGCGHHHLCPDEGLLLHPSTPATAASRGLLVLPAQALSGDCALPRPLAPGNTPCMLQVHALALAE